MTEKRMTIADAIRNATLSTGSLTRIRTDEQVIEEAAKAMLDAQDAEARDEACKQMIEALLYTKSLQWWDQFDIDVSECGS